MKYLVSFLCSIAVATLGMVASNHFSTTVTHVYLCGFFAGWLAMVIARGVEGRNP